MDKLTADIAELLETETDDGATIERDRARFKVFSPSPPWNPDLRPAHVREAEKAKRETGDAGERAQILWRDLRGFCSH